MESLTIFLQSLIEILKFAILARVLLSWFQQGQPGRFSQALYEITEPILSFFRSLLPRTGMLDLSPLIAYFVLDLAQYGLVHLSL